MTCLHKYYNARQLIEYFSDAERCDHTFFTLGIKDDEFDKLTEVKKATDLRYVCVDAANGYTKFFVERVKRIREAFPP